MNRFACAALVALAAAAAGCATAQAKGDPGGPALTPPPPPAHSISPVEIPPELPPPADTAPTPVVVKTPPRPASSRSDRQADRTGEKPEGATPAGAPSPPAPGAAAPAPALQTTANVTELEKRVRARMGQASRDLDRTDYRVLSSERRGQYDTAKRFIQQAEDALKVMNLVFAEQLADKAATLAAALAQK